MRYRGRGKNLKSFLVKVLSPILVVVLLGVQAPRATADSLSDLNRQRQILAQQIEDARKQAQLKQSQVDELKKQLDKVISQINQSQNALSQTANQISQTQNTIEDLAAQIKVQEDNLASEKSKMANVVNAWYMEDQRGLLESLLGANNISDAVNAEEAYNAVRQQINVAQDKITQAKNQLNQQKSDQEKQLLALSGLKSDQEAEKNRLEVNKQLQNRLLTDTKNTIASLQQKQQQAQARIGEIDTKIRALTATRTWGDQIVSSNDGSWYYMQTGNYTHLGDSPYTVSQYGCLITSFAMIATYYGHHVTPSDIASNSSIFDDDGYLLVSTPPGIGINTVSSQAINWGTIDSELANGHPVIVSIYLPSVGAVNRDGSSHFIVIKGKSGSKYLMHDPIGDGRGYNLSQARSMKILRPY